MNIILKTHSGRIVARPDTTWEKDNEDFYPPEFVESMTFSPVIFCRVSKPGRSVGERFASRYYDGIGFGVMLYPENLIDGSAEGYAQASCLDHTSFLPYPTFAKETMEENNAPFKLCKDGEVVYSSAEHSLEVLEQAIVEATKMVYIRTGDIVAVELDLRKALASRPLEPQTGSLITSVSGTCGERTVLDFKIIF